MFLIQHHDQVSTSNSEKLTRKIFDTTIVSDLSTSVSSRTEGTLSLMVQAPTMSLKTLVSKTQTIEHVTTKLRQKFPGETDTWRLYIGTSTYGK
jgi:hypothetical protein